MRSFKSYGFCLRLSFLLISIITGETNMGIASNTASVLTESKKPNDQGIVSDDQFDRHINNIFMRNKMQEEALRLFEAGFYDEAIQKYKEALHPSLLNNDHEQSHPRGAIRDIYRYQGKFELALEEHRWFLKRNSSKEEYIEKKIELDALLEARNTQSKEPILRYIKFLRENHKKELPPEMYNARATSYASQIIRLYDYIGDAVNGIAFVDQVLAYFSKWNNVKKAIAEYLKIREAFEEDKKQGFKGCLDAKPGTVCMGRATQALIQSDYFPW